MRESTQRRIDEGNAEILMCQVLKKRIIEKAPQEELLVVGILIELVIGFRGVE